VESGGLASGRQLAVGGCLADFLILLANADFLALETLLSLVSQ